jgi:hypothetical protein
MKITTGTMQRYSSVWICAGLLVLEGLILLPTHILMTDKGGVVLPDQSSLALIIYSLPPLGLFIAAFLLFSDLNLFNEWRNTDPNEDWSSHVQRRRAGWTAVTALILCVILLAKSLHNLYWLLLWDKTADGIGYGWLVFAPLPVAIIMGIMLIIALEGRQRLAGLLYLLFIPGFLIMFAIRAPLVDPRQATERHAEQVVHAIEAFHARMGFYPPELRYLISWDNPRLPAPVIIYGQDWCYKGRNDYYTLGYVYHKDWSDPHLVGEVYKTVGNDPDSSSVCNTEMEVLRLQRYVPYIP